MVRSYSSDPKRPSGYYSSQYFASQRHRSLGLPYSLGMSQVRRKHDDQTELAILGQIRARAARLPGKSVRIGIGDDCALLQLKPNEEFAVTTDLSIAGRHFDLGLHQPEAIGHRTLARGLSDLAAMGARPVAAFLSLGIPRELAGKWLDGFLNGFLALAEASQTPLAGGDLSESPVAVADIVLTGAVKRGRVLLRSGAHPGDLLYVTGSLGGAAAGLTKLKRRTASRRSDSTDLAPHLYPQPRIAQGLWLVRRSLATAAIDISDGLSTELAHLCEESGVAAEVNEASLPIHAGASIKLALDGGEDYELLFTASPRTRIPRSIAGVPVSCIGRIVKQRKGGVAIRLIGANGATAIQPGGWEHFR